MTKIKPGNLPVKPVYNDPLEITEAVVMIWTGTGCSFSQYKFTPGEYIFDDLLNDIGMEDKVFRPHDLDYAIIPGVQMMYTSDRKNGNLNPVATKILLDYFKLEVPVISDVVDIFRYCPHGPVVFPNMNADRLRAVWPSLFRSHMPYEQLRRVKGSHSIKQYIEMYKNSNEPGIFNLILASLGETRRQITAGTLDRVLSTIIGAAISIALEPWGFNNFNIFNKIGV